MFTYLLFLAHELLRNECKPFEWRDQFANEALHILAQHAVQVRDRPKLSQRKMNGK